MDDLLDEVLGFMMEVTEEMSDIDRLRFYDLLMESIEEKKYDLLENI